MNNSKLPIEKMLQTATRKGADFAEVFVEQTSQTSIVCDDKKLENIATFIDTGLGFRTIICNRTAYGSTNDFTRKNLFALARNVTNTSRLKRTNINPISLREKTTLSITTVSRHPFGTELKEKCNIALRASDVAWKSGALIRQVRVLYRDTVRRIYIATSNGNCIQDEQVDTVLTVQVIASDGINLQTGYESVGAACGFEIFDEKPPEEIAERAAMRAIQMLSARLAPKGEMTVILSAKAGGTMIHEAVGHGLEADLVGEGMSVYSGKLGQKVANELVSVVDDATLPGARGSFTFDDEGRPSQKTSLIEGGILKAYLSSQATSRRYGFTPTGNARRQSYTHPPIVRMTNTFILSGKDDPAQILRDTQSGLLVLKIGGGQVNTINGDFVFEVQEGYIIENGNKGEAVRGALLIGNGPRVLMEIDRVGNDLGFSIGTCGKDGQEIPVSCGQPTIRIPKLVVGGR